MRVTMLLACLAAVACSGDSGPALEIGDVTIYAPLPGSRAAVAYLEFRNTSDADVVVDAVTSPSFGRVEIHESRLVDGVSTMRSVDRLEIPAGETVVLGPRGIHLMLMEPADAAGVGDSVSLSIRYDASGEILVRSTLESRVRLDPN